MRTAKYPRIEDPHDSLTGSLQAKDVESFHEFGRVAGVRLGARPPAGELGELFALRREAPGD